MFEGSVEGRQWEILGVSRWFATPGRPRWRVATLLAYGTRFNLGWTAIEEYRPPGSLLALEHGLIWTAIGYEAFRLKLNRNAIPMRGQSCATVILS